MKPAATTPATARPGTPPAAPELRALHPEDLDGVVALDRRIGGPSRRGYFEKRLAAALKNPKRHLQFALADAGGLRGFLLARIAGGEYGQPGDAVVIEAVGVDPQARHQGLGRRMLEGLEGLMRSRGLALLTTQADWRNHDLLAFLAGAGFQLAPRPILECTVDRVPLPNDDEELDKAIPVVRALKEEDFLAVTRIDRRITGQDRSAYLRRKFDEALKESAIAVSLVAVHQDLPVAFAMARVDFGDFGHVEPVAALDTLGVEPGFQGHGYGRAVLGQMIENLAALHVERLETEVSRDELDLLRFLYRWGFQPSQRLCFHKPLAVPRS